IYGSGYRLTGPVERLHGPPPRAGHAGGLAARIRARLFGSRQRVMATAGALSLGLGLAVAGAALWWASTARQQATEREREVEALLTFLSSGLVAEADPCAATRQEESWRQVVERTAATMDDRLRDDPATRAVLHRMVGQAFSGWGEYEKAVSHFDRA